MHHGRLRLKRVRNHVSAVAQTKLLRDATSQKYSSIADPATSTRGVARTCQSKCASCVLPIASAIAHARNWLTQCRTKMTRKKTIFVNLFMGGAIRFPSLSEDRVELGRDCGTR